MDLDELDCPKFKPTSALKTYQKVVKKVEDLTTINAVNFLLAGTLKSKVCRYCLSVTDELFELDKVMEIANKGGLYSVTVKDMIASFHPFKVADDPNFPNRICNKCLDRTLNSYLFTQQCEQAERALRNCFEDINEKFFKLDPLDKQQTHRRGRKKNLINHNRITVNHSKVIDYADPIIHIVNTHSEPLSSEPAINPLECLKCCQVLPNIQSLASHTNSHPATMWFTCRLCAQSFPKLYLLKRHYRDHQEVPNSKMDSKKFECKTCSEVNKNCYKHLQHLEKHHFKMVLEHLLYRQMDQLCTVCLGKETLVPLDDVICLYGGPPEMMGDRTIQSILDSILPELNEKMNEYTGSKVCEKCLNSALTTYTFMHNTYFARKRLSTCVNHMLENLKDITPEKTLCIEIAKGMIMPIKLDESIDDDLKEDTDDEDMKKEVFLEDEYRIKSEDEIEPEIEPLQNHVETKSPKTEVKDEVHLNGYQLDVREFLKFKKPKIQKVERILTCPMCDKHFLSDYFVKKHILKHISMKMKCIPCGTEFGNKFALKEHTKYAHELFQSDYRACKICGRGFAKIGELKNHEKIHKNKTCLLCNKVFKTQRFYNIHMKRHIPKLMILKKIYGKTCSFCEIECSNDNQLLLHVNKVHLQIKPYSCDMCEKKFYTEYNLRFHKKIHSKYSKEKCNFCGRIFKSRKLLVIHIRKHIGATPHRCQLCNQAFYSQAKLKYHMNLNHSGSFVCKICKHVSVSKNELKLHEAKSHSFL